MIAKIALGTIVFIATTLLFCPLTSQGKDPEEVTVIIRVLSRPNAGVKGATVWITPTPPRRVEIKKGDRDGDYLAVLPKNMIFHVQVIHGNSVGGHRNLCSCDEKTLLVPIMLSSERPATAASGITRFQRIEALAFQTITAEKDYPAPEEVLKFLKNENRPKELNDLPRLFTKSAEPFAPLVSAQAEKLGKILSGIR
jgi:hypothetical protein